MEWLAQIPGQQFLCVYLVLFVACIAVCWKHIRGASAEFPLPDKNKVDHISFAALRGGWEAVIDVVVIQLIEREIIGIEEQNGEKLLVVKQQTNDLSELETVIYEYVKVPKSMVAFRGTEIQGAVENCLQPVYRELERMHLWKTDSELQAGQQLTYINMLVLELLAGAKALLGFTNNKPIGFLVVLIFLVPLVMMCILRPKERLTGLGKKYIKEVVSQFSWIKDDLSGISQHDSSLMKYALGVAIFGVGILVVDEMLGDYRGFAQSQYGMASNGFYGGDSGTGSSDSGGGSDGGSGCGGCGGCGSD